MFIESLQQNRCFKLICAASNQDIEQVEKLAAIYSAAGANLIDIAADIDVYKALIHGYKRIDKYTPVCISIGTKGDGHFKKAKINNDKCSKCSKCVPACPQIAINDDLIIDNKKCIGCSLCASRCSFSAIDLIDEFKTPQQVLKEFEDIKVDCIELHSNGEQVSEIFDYWYYLNDNYDGILSICLSGNILSDDEKVSIVKELLTLRKPYTTIIQADGLSMSGYTNTQNTTQKALDATKLFLQEALNAYIIPSGGTNEQTFRLAKEQNLNINGVAFGTYARKLVSEYTQHSDFFDNYNQLSKAINKAESLIVKKF